MNYRLFYEKQTGEKIPENFEVHHIDHNRKNNSIDNLVAIPKKLHKKYHSKALGKFNSALYVINNFGGFMNKIQEKSTITSIIDLRQNQFYYNN